MNRYLILIPFYNHIDQFKRFCVDLNSLGIDVLIVDDGSLSEQSGAIQKICNSYNFFYIRHSKNQGKGSACLSGVKWASLKGYSHIIQIDADGQHTLNNLHSFLEQSKLYPDSIINSYPIYDKSVPKVRKIGHLVNQILLCIETLGFNIIKDSLVGFRIYPLKSIQPISSSICCKRFGL